MPPSNNPDPRGALVSDFHQVRENWFWLLALGIFLTFVGIAAVAVPALATVGVVTVLGILMIVAGAAQIVSAFTAGKWGGVILHLLVGILYAVVGFLVLENPLKGAAGITLLIAVLFFVEGIFRIVVAVQHKFPSWRWTLLSGTVSVLLGIIIWRQLKDEENLSFLWVIGLLVGIDLLFNGTSLIMLALAARRMPEPEPEKPGKAKAAG